MKSSFQHLTFFFARLANIWYIYDELSPQIVAQEALKQWHTPAEALTHLLQRKMLPSNVAYAACLLWCNLDSRDTLSDPQVLRSLLAVLSITMQAEAFAYITHNEQERMASLLTSFASPALPGLVPTARAIAAQWSAITRHDDLAFQFYAILPAYGIAQSDVHLLVARASIARGQVTVAEQLLLDLVKQHPTADALWLLAQVSHMLERVPQVQFQYLLAFIHHTPDDQRTEQALHQLGELYRVFLQASKTAQEATTTLQSLHALLEYFPEVQRAQKLMLVAQRDDAFLALALSALAAFPVTGLHHTAQSLMEQWKVEPRSDFVAFQLYRALPAYGITKEQVGLLIARAFLVREQYSQAEQTLQSLQADALSPDVLWLLADVSCTLRRPVQTQLEIVTRFIQRFSADRRVGQAWQHIGDLYGEQSQDGMAAVRAYQQAAQLGRSVPQLAAYIQGHWQAIPALRSHQDAAFPVIVALDLEVDPLAEAQPGERVYEVAAVRMKGQTVLADYHSYVQRPFRPAKWQNRDLLEQAPPTQQVAQALHDFVGNAFVVGHNLRAFDAHHLAGMGVALAEEQMLDTLTFSRLLYPDSLHHHLALLCHVHGITIADEAWHTALPDARACGFLWHALGDELIRRGGMLLTGMRALVQPESAFDRAVLQPRHFAADPRVSWSFDPRPTPYHGLAIPPIATASPAMQQALGKGQDGLVELYDPHGAYCRYLPLNQRTLVAVQTQARIEEMLALQRFPDAYILPDPHTLLCPERVRSLLEQSNDDTYRLHLFCLYQASHNHDLRTLYLFRRPDTDAPELRQLRADLRRACCVTAFDDSHHAQTCRASQAHLKAMQQSAHLFTTHEVLLHQFTQPEADLIVVDDLAELHMHLADYVAQRIESDHYKTAPLTVAERDAFAFLNSQIAAYVQAYAPQPRYHERLPLRQAVRFLLEPAIEQDQQGGAVCDRLQASGSLGKCVAQQVKQLCEASQQHTHHQHIDGQSVRPPLQAYWLDAWFSEQQAELQRWAICGINEDLGAVFQRTFWQPYKQRILCGPALVIGKQTERFFERSLGIPPNLPLLSDARPATTVHIPTPALLPSAGFLSRLPWIRQVGRLLFMLQTQPRYRSLVVTLHQKGIIEALAQAFSALPTPHPMQALSLSLGWTTTKIAERMNDPERATCTFVSPHIRRTYLDSPVDVEVTGPLHCLQQHDPLVAASMRLFADLYPEDGPFLAYLLPQALLELKTRLSSPAQVHIILDSRLHAKAYRDEVFAMLQTLTLAEAPFDVESKVRGSEEQEQFIALLTRALTQRGMQTHEDIADEELRLVLRTFWNAADFKNFPTEETMKRSVSQKDIVRGVLDGKDQLLVAATGGGKSLCFQMPAVFLAHDVVPKVTLVFSPLISLMTDQVESLWDRGVFSAIMINSSLSSIQRQEHLRGLQRGDYSIIYIAPEQIRSPGLRKALEAREIGLVVVDEAHCLSQWGHDFRTDYFAVKDWIHRFYTGEQRPFPILALTATARQGYIDQDNKEFSDQASTVSDIINKLRLSIQGQEAMIASPEREELNFRVISVEPGLLYCIKCGNKLENRGNKLHCPHCHTHFSAGPALETAVEKSKIQHVLTLLQDDGPEGLRSQWNQPFGMRMRGIIYCAYTKTTELVAEKLRIIKGLRVDFYHAKRTSEEKEDILRRFKSDKADGLDLIVATSAFGMGIDVRRLGFVIHFDTPGTPEAYYQEAGRAGRDEAFRSKQHQALCILLYHPSDLNKQRYLNRKNSITRYHIEDVYTVLNEVRVAIKEGQAEQTAQEIIITTRDLATRASISEEQVGMILYYLEYHTQLHSNSILERGEITANILRLKFEQGYQTQINRLPPHSPSRPLLAYFLESELFCLSKDTLTTLSLRELADTLGWSISKVEREILNLAQRHIITYECAGRMCWVHDAEYARNALVTLQKNIRQLFNDLSKKHPATFLNGELVYEDLLTFCAKMQNLAVPVPALLRFLATLSHSDMRELRLLKRFTRTTRRPQVGRYEISLWRDEQGESPSQRLTRIFGTLAEAITFLQRQHIQEEEQEFDLLRLEPDYHARQQLHLLLILLDMLGIVRYTSDPSIGLALRVTLKQPAVPAVQLDIDLASLRLKETHDKQKLKRMEQYAEKKEEASEVFKTYFSGAQPLVERIDQTRRTDLIPNQQTLLRLENGLHLIEGPAGCGKTTVLVEYIKHLVYDRLVPIERIMVTTHYHSATSRIAKELEVLQESGNVALTTTINKFGERIFRQYRLLLLRGDGLPYFEKDPVLHTDQRTLEEKELTLVSKALSSVHTAGWLSQDSWLADLNIPTLTGSYRRNDERERECLDVIRRFRIYGVFPLNITTNKMITEITGKMRDEVRALYYAAYLVFLRLLGQENFYTFDDQILFALAILQSRPEIVREYQHFYEYILVDELQDFTPAQVSLFLQLCRVQHNVLAFGDRDQEIRVKKDEGASSVFDQIADQDACGERMAHHLTTHFRSTQRILNLVDAIRTSGEKKRPTLQSARNVEGAMPVMLHVHAYDDPFTDMIPLGNEDVKAAPMEVMVEAVLQQLQQIPVEECGSTALIAFKSEERLSIERSLRKRGIAFSTLLKDSLYQLHHVKRVLVYLYLILEKNDEDLQFLLRSSVVPYFEYQQVKKVKDIAYNTKRPLFDLLYENRVLDRIEATQDQRTALQQHLAIITQWQPTSIVDEVLKALETLGQEGPLAVVKEQEQKYNEVQEALKGLRGKTIKAAVHEVKQHIVFLDGEKKHTGLFVTTIDHAKSEEFDSVFILRADYLKFPAYSSTIRTCQRRLYVATSRARERLYLVLSAHSRERHPLLRMIPKTLYEDYQWWPAETEE